MEQDAAEERDALKARLEEVARELKWLGRHGLPEGQDLREYLTSMSERIGKPPAASSG